MSTPIEQPEAVTEALWDWLEDGEGRDFIEFLHARGWTCVPIDDEERRRKPTDD